MPYTVDSPTQTILEGKARGVHWLIECDFTSGIGRYTTAPIDVVSPNTYTYIGLGMFLTVEPVQENAGPDIGSINIKLGIVSKAMLALLSGDQSVYRGRKIYCVAQFFNKDFAPIGTPIRRWTGVMNPISIHREKPDESNGNTYGYIEMACQRRGLERARNNMGLRMTHEQQQLAHPGDLFFEYQNALIENPSPWLTIDFQKV